MGSPWKALCSASAVYTGGCIAQFLASRDRELHHANVFCVDDAGMMLG